MLAPQISHECLAADSTLGTGQTLGPRQHPGDGPEPGSPSLGAIDCSWECQQARELDPGPEVNHGWKASPLLGAKLKGSRSALPRSQEIILSFMSNVTVGNGEQRGSAKAVPGRAAIPLHCEQQGSFRDCSELCQKAGTEKENGQLSLEPAAPRINLQPGLAEMGAHATPLLPSL